MKCPMCADQVLQPYRHELGIELDFCGGCRGMWFDRSELEYLLARAVATPAAPQPPPGQRAAASPASDRTIPPAQTGRVRQVERQAHLRPMPAEGHQKQQWIDEMMDFFD